MTDIATCPKCGSPSVQGMEVSSRDIPAAIVSEYFLGIAAGVTAGRKKVLQNYCVKCGQRWIPGTSQEEELRIRSGQYGEEALRQLQNADERDHKKLAEAQKKADQRRMYWIIAAVILVLLAVALPNRIR